MKFQGIVILIVLAWLPFNSYGQELIPKIGYASSTGHAKYINPYATAIVVNSSESRGGLVFGVEYKGNISERFSLRTGLTYCEKSFFEEVSVQIAALRCGHNCPVNSSYFPGYSIFEYHEWKFRYFQVPITLDYYITSAPQIGKPTLLISLGAYLSAVYDAKENGLSSNKGEDEVGLQVGTGLVFPGIRFECSYALGSTSYNLKTLQFTMGIPIRLRKKLPANEK